MRKLHCVVGTRPNFVKLAALTTALSENKDLQKLVEIEVIHTGQHFDQHMSQSFFDQLRIPSPKYSFRPDGVGHGAQLGAMMSSLEGLWQCVRPNVVVVFGDVNSTLAAAISAKKLGIHVSHVEAGIRSHDSSMPEEINRILVDSVADSFFTTTDHALENLKKTGVSECRIYNVGNCMVDTLLGNIHQLQAPEFLANDVPNEFVLATMHRPGNVDNLIKFESLVSSIRRAVGELTVFFPIHPRISSSKRHLKILEESRFEVVPALPYLQFLFAMRECRFIITDSGGASEEASILGRPCVTLRENTERPETVELGTNYLVGNDEALLVEVVSKILSGNFKYGGAIPLWDGKTGGRILEILAEM